MGSSLPASPPISSLLQGLLDIERDVLTYAQQHKPSRTEQEEQPAAQQEVQEGAWAAESHPTAVAAAGAGKVYSYAAEANVSALSAELLASEEAQQVRQQLDALLEESKQLSAALAQWQAAKEAADLQVTRIRDRLAEPPAVTTNGKPAGTNGAATAGAVSTNGIAAHEGLNGKSIVQLDGEDAENNGAAVEEYGDSGEMECDVITRQCSNSADN